MNYISFYKKEIISLFYHFSNIFTLLISIIIRKFIKCNNNKNITSFKKNQKIIFIQNEKKT